MVQRETHRKPGYEAFPLTPDIEKRPTESSAKTVVRNSLFLFGQNALVTVASVVITAIIARRLGKTDYGTFTYAFAFANLFFVFASMGLRPVTVRAIAQTPDRLVPYLGMMFPLRLVLGLVATAVLLLLSRLLHQDRMVILTVAIASGTVLFNSVSSIFRDVFQGFENLSVEAVTAVLVRAFTFLGALLAIALGGGLLSLAWVYAAGGGIGCLYPYIVLRKQHIAVRPRVNASEALGELRKGLPFALASILAIFTSRINPILLGTLSTQAMVGVYAAAMSITSVLQAVPDAIATSLFPTVARGYRTQASKTSHLLQRAFFYLALLGLPIAVGGFLCSDVIIGTIFGHKFVETPPVFRLLILSVPLEFLMLPANFVLGAMHLQKAVLIRTAIGAALNVFLSFLLIPRYGAVGSAWALLATYFFCCIASLAILARHIRVFAEPARYARLAAANLVFGLILFSMRQFNPFLVIPAGALLYLGLTLVFRLMSFRQMSDFLRQSLGAPKAA
ncbi:MAG: flippase [Pseudomonadota bacterium]